jgi:hypothetical protein
MNLFEKQALDWNLQGTRWKGRQKQTAKGPYFKNLKANKCVAMLAEYFTKQYV